ncbi:MAG TPA: hypothetical protein DCG53_01790 [Syntrophus sp. (in: bacteria)]|nr:hypothetical protein [Syntrophus sp. (in: bacteria)]
MNRRIVQVLILVMCFGIIGTAYFLLLSGYQQESQKTVLHFSPLKPGEADYVRVTAKIASLDPVRGELVLRMQFEPQGALLDKDDVLISAVIVYTNSAAGKSETTFKKGESMQPLDVNMALQGDSSQFPWDRYTGLLWVCIASQKERDRKSTSWSAVPFSLDLKPGITGFKIGTNEIKQKDRGFSTAEIAFDVERSRSSLGFAVFIMVLIGLLTLAAFLAGFAVIVGGRKIEMSMLGWLGGMLFALVPLRNAMPGAPPIGCLADYMSFFWAEAITAATLIAIALTWVLRKNS